MKSRAQLEAAYAELRTKITIRRDELSDEILCHAEYYRQVRENGVWAAALAEDAIREKATVFAELCDDERARQIESGGKVTKDTVEQVVRATTKYLNACYAVTDAGVLRDMYEGLADAFKQRSFRLNNLVEVHKVGLERDYVRETPARPRRKMEDV